MVMNVIQLHQVSKTYTHYSHGFDRLLELITHRAHHQSFMALHPLDLTIHQGQVVGIIGDNGAGKSTLLKMIAGTLRADLGGQCEIKGRVAALLELGGGFHPEMSGRENVYLSCTMMGLSLAEINQLYEKIVNFSGIAEFIDQPVKTYSSGMFVRLAFSVATCVEPDILIIDEALSVGDGAFARRSFNRIMQFKQAGKTILFCSHALYQVEAICDRVIWLEQGQVKQDGLPSRVVAAYTEAISLANKTLLPTSASNPSPMVAPIPVEGTAHFTEIKVSVDGITGRQLEALSLESELSLTIAFASDPNLPAPTVGLLVTQVDGRVITSAGTQHDGLTIERDPHGNAKVRVQFSRLALLKGEYWLDIYLLCESAIHVYDKATNIAQIQVHQRGLEQGVVSLPRRWAQV
jgi:lipopolysaccharide transport system ATP-binding protein